jgi:histidinol-phosphate/aromatic aminotransferase/cobyric acid decarboxylase-like protein
MDMIQQMRSESAIGMVANVAIAADMAKAKAEQAIDEVTELREKLKETLNYLGEYSGHVNSRFNNILNHQNPSPHPTLPTI